MKLSFTTLGCPDWTLRQIAENAAQYGYGGVELRTHADGNHLAPDATAAELENAAAIFRTSGVQVFSIMGYSRFAFLDDAEVAANQALVRKLLDVAQAFGAGYIRIFAGVIPKGAEVNAMTERVAAAIKPLAHEASERGIRLALETHDDWCGGAQLKKLAGLIDEPRGFGYVYDFCNCILAKLEKWEETYAAIKSHILYCHVKDVWFDGDGKHQYVALGGGYIPVKAVLARLKADGFGGYFSFEWEKKWHPEIEAPERVFPQYVHKFRRIWNGME